MQRGAEHDTAPSRVDRFKLRGTSDAANIPQPLQLLLVERDQLLELYVLDAQLFDEGREDALSPSHQLRSMKYKAIAIVMTRQGTSMNHGAVPRPIRSCSIHQP